MLGLGAVATASSALGAQGEIVTAAIPVV